MAEVKNFNSYAKGKLNKDADDSEDFSSFNDKIRSHRLHVFYRTILSIILVAAVTIVIYIQWKDKIFSQMVYTENVTISDNSGSSVIALGDNIVQHSKDGISCMNVKGEAMWNQTYEMQSPIIHTCDDALAVGDYNGNNIYVADTSGILGQINTNLPIRDFCISAQGVVAVILDDSDVTWINLYDSAGNSLANIKTTMQDSGYPLAVAISPNGQLVSVSYINAQDSDIKTSIAFYNFGSVGQNEVDNYASGYDYQGSLVPTVKFMNSKTAFAVSDDRIMFYSGSEVLESKAENLFGTDEVRSVFSSDEYVGIVFNNGTDDGAYRLQVYNTSGTLVLTKYFNIEYSDIVFGKDQFTIYNSSEMLLCAIDGTEKFAGDFKNDIKAIIPSSSRNHFTLVTSNSINQIELR